MDDNTQSIKSPFVEQPEEKKEFDYNTLRDETAGEAIKDVLRLWGENADNLVFKHDTEKAVFIEKLDAVAMKTINVLTERKVPDSDMQYMIDSLYTIIQQVFSIVGRLKTEWEKELLARVIGERNPGTEKYSREYATLQGLVSALERVRKEQGDEGRDYFFIQNEKTDKGTTE